MNKMNDNETVLYAAVLSALTFERLFVVEAVIRELKPKIPFLGDEALDWILSEVKSYVAWGREYVDDKKFLPEWADVLDELTDEKRIRAEYRKMRGNPG